MDQQTTTDTATTAPAPWQWQPNSATNRLITNDGTSVLAVTMPSSGTPRISVRPQYARLIEQAPALLAHAEKCLRMLIAKRDCHLEGCSTVYGQVADSEDREIIDSYDRDIDKLKALVDACRAPQ